MKKKHLNYEYPPFVNSDKIAKDYLLLTSYKYLRLIMHVHDATSNYKGMSKASNWTKINRRLTRSTRAWQSQFTRVGISQAKSSGYYDFLINYSIKKK